MKKSVAGAAVLLALAGSAGAGTLDFLTDWNTGDLYMGLSISNSDISGETGIGQDMNVYNATLGYTLWRGLGVETRFGAGSDEAKSVLQDPLSNYFAGMLRYHYTWNNNLMAYAAAGGAFRTHSDLLDVDETQAGAAFAVGVNLFGSDSTAINIEYLYLGGEQATKSIGIGFQHYFK
jgi:hypothetical protein